MKLSCSVLALLAVLALSEVDAKGTQSRDVLKVNEGGSPNGATHVARKLGAVEDAEKAAKEAEKKAEKAAEEAAKAAEKAAEGKDKDMDKAAEKAAEEAAEAAEEAAKAAEEAAKTDSQAAQDAKAAAEASAAAAAASAAAAAKTVEDYWAASTYTREGQCKMYAHYTEENEDPPTDQLAPKPEKCVMKRASHLLQYEPNFPLDRPDVYIEVKIGDGTIYDFHPHDYDDHGDLKKGSIPIEDINMYNILFDEQEKLGGAGFKLRYVSKNGYGAWNSCKYSPIAFDLNNSGGVERIEDEACFEIDITGDGNVEKLRDWFAPTEGILVDVKVKVGEDDFEDEGIVTGNQLMGDMGGQYSDGFEKLGSYDENCDGKLTDKELKGLYIWTDANSNTIVDEGELSELKDHDIESIYTSHTGLKSKAGLKSGGEMVIEDLWFNACEEGDDPAAKASSFEENVDDTPKVSAFGDPHLKTWSGETFDYNGECDLVMLHSEGFMGKGLDIHIRTKILDDFSYIETAAIKIGNDILEVSGYGESYLNGERNVQFPNHIDDYRIRHVQDQTKRRHKFKIDLNNKGSKIWIETYDSFVAVSFKGAVGEHVEDSIGLMGTFTGGFKLARDGKTDLAHDINAFGQEWQVRNTEQKLFHELKGVQFPNTCLLPEPKTATKLRRRNLNGITREMAEEACAEWGADKEACISDVLKTGDLGMALEKSIGAF